MRERLVSEPWHAGTGTWLGRSPARRAAQPAAASRHTPPGAPLSSWASAASALNSRAAPSTLPASAPPPPPSSPPPSSASVEVVVVPPSSSSLPSFFFSSFFFFFCWPCAAAARPAGMLPSGRGDEVRGRVSGRSASRGARFLEPKHALELGSRHTVGTLLAHCWHTVGTLLATQRVGGGLSDGPFPPSAPSAPSTTPLRSREVHLDVGQL